MQIIFEYLSQYLLFRNFIEVLSGLDNTILLLIISLPTGFTKDGLPIGIQLVAAYGREDILFQVGAQIENQIQWSQKRAPIHA